MKTKIVYEDKDIVVCHKPAGLAVQTDKIGQMDVVSELKNYLKQSYLGVVHRLDQPVEGLLIFAKNQHAAAGLSKQLINGNLNKNYYAVCYGKFENSEGFLTDYLVRDSVTKKSKIATSTDAQAKKAVLRFKVLKAEEKKSLLDVTIETGRFHQIRVQLANAGHPILGDAKYKSEESEAVSMEEHIKNLQLFAYSISFRHPKNNQKMEFELDEIPALK